jgi:hypothetical protein
MRRSAGPAAALVLTLLGCGAGDGIVVELSDDPLLADADVVAVYFYGPEVACQVVKQTLPRPPAILGPLQAPVDAMGKERGIVFNVPGPIPVGEYVVFADALDVNGANVGSGCSPGQQILDREVAKIRVVITP